MEQTKCVRMIGVCHMILSGLCPPLVRYLIRAYTLTEDTNRPVLKGDSGGGAVQYLRHKAVLIGLMIQFEYQNETLKGCYELRIIRTYFLNIAIHVNWIRLNNLK